ncbi:MAG: GNAT family N-acetyltransferase [Peptostreptococcaceae bacterium]|nr:GNAT family N-acetyltransferase [Peptostreptococcaceae bacterium]
MLQGKKVKLVAIEEKDLQQLMEWRNLPESKKYFREYREINFSMQKKWFEEKVIKDPNTIMFSIREATTEELLGCCGLCYINWIYSYADLSLYIGWQESYIDEKGYAKESCQLLFDYAFNQLNLNKIWTEIYEFDNKKLELYKSLGMHLDGVLRQNYYYNGQWWNSNILSKLKIENILID